MTSMVIDFYEKIFKWVNDNQGVVSIVIFLITLFIGWVSGIFSALRRKPRFKLSLLDGPTFCCTYLIGKKHGEYDAHRTGFALYLVVANVGSAPSSIDNISIGYHWQLRPISVQWFKYSIGWFWLTNQAAALEDFQAKIGNSTKVYPFLVQKNFLSPVQTDTYLDVGRSTNGVLYFEQSNSWGGCFPRIHNDQVKIKVRVRDVFGSYHSAKFSVPSVALEHARKYNPAFGKTFSEIHGESLPFDNPPM